MPRYITDEKGFWHPAKENVALVNRSSKPMANPSATWSNYYGQVVQPGASYIYEGPDRAAMFELFEQGVDKLGSDFNHDPDLIMRVKQLGFSDIKEYARVMGFDEQKAKDRFVKQASTVSGHDLPAKVAAINRLGGGTDSSGSGADVIGGFGDERLRPVSEVRK